MKKLWSPNDLMKLFKIEKAKNTIHRAEASGAIPEASRVKKGKTHVRMWKTNDLPTIGKHFGFLNTPNEPKIISIYTPKGGVLKTTLSFNLGRMLAINGINTLIIGLDVQGSITHNLYEDDENIDSIEEITELQGLYETIIKPKEGGCKINDVIKKTELPTLSYIPETSNLNFLEQKIREKTRREYFLDTLIKPLKNKFDVIIFDNSPNWNFLIQNSLVAATDVICPIACDIETFRSLAQNIEMINEFKDLMALNWNNFILVPTKVERTKLSTQIEAQYRRSFPDIITSSSIRAAAKGQESSLEKLSSIEYDPRSPLSDDYYSVINDIWKKINPTITKKTTKKKKKIAEEA